MPYYQQPLQSEWQARMSDTNKGPENIRSYNLICILHIIIHGVFKYNPAHANYVYYFFLNLILENLPVPLQS